MVDTILGHKNAVEGCLNMKVFIGAADVHKRFFVMKPGKMYTPIILGQPWQRQYDCTLKWNKNATPIVNEGEKPLIPFTKSEDTTTTIDDRLSL